MNVLKTTKVVVIDDQPEEAMPVVEALGKMGVGAVYLNPTRRLPDSPLSGVRVLFLDMDLEGSAGEDKRVVGHTLSVLEKVVARDSSPLVIITWTKHEEYLDIFKKRLCEEWHALTPGFVSSIPKPDRFDEDIITQIAHEIVNLIDNSFPLKLLWSWEQLVHDAAVETTSSLAALATTDAALATTDIAENALQYWNKAMSLILGKLGIAVAGQQLSKEALLQDIFAALNPVHMDHLGRKTSGLNLESEKLRELFEIARNAESDGRAEARLNSKFLIEEINVDSTEPSPGIIYEPGDASQRSFPLSIQQGLFNLIIRDVFEEGILDKDMDGITEEIERLEAKENLSSKQRKKLEKLRAQKLLIQKEKIKPVVLEITPPCDFSQRKNKMARFVGGLWVPQEMKRFIKKHTTFLKEIGPLAVNASDDDLLYLVLDSHFLFGYPKPKRTWKAKYRLRSQVLVDVQAWFASHAARPGYTSITP